MGWENRDYNTGDSTVGPRLSDYRPSGLTLALIVVLTIVYLLTHTRAGSDLGYWGVLTFTDHIGWKQPWRFLTYPYLHGSAEHLFFNLLSIYFLLPLLERLWGWRRTFAIYTAGGIVAGLTYAALSPFIGHDSVLFGASGCITAVLGVEAAIMPGLMFFGIVPIRIVALLYAIFYVLSIVGDGNLANAAHLGGLAFGYALPLAMNSQWEWASRWPERLRQASARRVAAAAQNEERSIDRILEKVHIHGMNSLSRHERNLLKRATERQRQNRSRPPSYQR